MILISNGNYSNDIELFHYNETTKKYKVININKAEKGVFFRIVEGEKEKGKTTVSIKLNKQELAYLILELQKIYNEVK